jgi:hypothetical protein
VGFHEDKRNLFPVYKIPELWIHRRGDFVLKKTNSIIHFNDESKLGSPD